MKFTMHPTAAKALSTLLCCSTLAACGGAGSEAESDISTVQSSGPTRADISSTTPTTTLATVTTGTTAAITGLPNVRFQNTGAVAQSNVPVTFGQVFVVGALKPAEGLAGRFDDGSTAPVQVDVKALHPDGSVRHAVVSAVLPSLAAAEVRNMTLVKTGAAPVAGAITTDHMMVNGFSASVHATINGVRYDAFADDLIKMGKAKPWLSGPIANEWHVSAPLTASNGQPHPHLSARFAIRWYEKTRKARVDVTVENNWAYEPLPQNFTYDAQVLVGAKPVYTKAALTHLHHARWRKVFWWGGDAPAVNVKHNTAYLIGSKALPNYDQSITIPETTLAKLATRFSGAVTEPMNVGMAAPYMPQTGGRDDIGLLPGWAASYLLSMDKRARDATLGTADLAGSWSSHYRDRNTDRPVSLIDYPYMTVLGQRSDTLNPATRQYEAFPACASSTACNTTFKHDASHQPAFAYLPYLVTGDYYYLEELQFWAMWNVFSANPGYRQYAKGLLQADQVRAQAWSLRTLAEAAYITPDNDRLKAHFNQILNSNLDWYNATYTNNTAANQLGALVNGYALGYNSGTGLAPWQDDFFTSAVGHAAELGFTKAQSLLGWKAKFPISRMTAAGACWIDGAIYAMTVRDSSTSPFYTTMGQAYTKSHTATFNALACASPEMATALKLKVGEMTGYSAMEAGYPSNMQPALAYSANAGGTAGLAAWKVFMSRTVKPNYGNSPQFAIVPR